MCSLVRILPEHTQLVICDVWTNVASPLIKQKKYFFPQYGYEINFKLQS